VTVRHAFERNAPYVARCHVDEADTLVATNSDISGNWCVGRDLNSESVDKERVLQ